MQPQQNLHQLVVTQKARSCSTIRTWLSKSKDRNYVQRALLARVEILVTVDQAQFQTQVTLSIIQTNQPISAWNHSTSAMLRTQKKPKQLVQDMPTLTVAVTILIIWTWQAVSQIIWPLTWIKEVMQHLHLVWTKLLAQTVIQHLTAAWDRATVAPGMTTWTITRSLVKGLVSPTLTCLTAHHILKTSRSDQASMALRKVLWKEFRPLKSAKGWTNHPVSSHTQAVWIQIKRCSAVTQLSHLRTLECNARDLKLLTNVVSDKSLHLNLMKVNKRSNLYLIA